MCNITAHDYKEEITPTLLLFNKKNSKLFIIHFLHNWCIGLDRYWYQVSADTRQYWWVSVGTDTSSPVVHLPVSTVNTVATHAYSFKPIPYFCAYTPHTYITCTHLYPAQNCIFSTKKFAQPGIGIGIAAANSIGYRAPARYRSNPTGASNFAVTTTTW